MKSLTYILLQSLMDSRIFKKLRRNRIIFIVLITISMAGHVNCQSLARWVISPLGSQYDNNFQIVQATLGEPVISTVTDSATFFLTQGFQQPSLSELPYDEYKITINIYPNPVKTLVTIVFFVKDVDDFTVDVRDMLGKLILSNKVYNVYSGQAEFLDFSSFSQGIYFVHVFSGNEEMTIVEKIIKL